MPVPETVVDVEGALKAWFRAQAPVSAVVGNRVFLAMPKGGPSAWPAVTLFRVGGGLDDVDYPSDSARVQIDCWADLRQKGVAMTVGQAIVRSLRAMVCGTLLVPGVRAMGAHSITMMYLPDPQDGRPRYIVQAVVQAQSV